MALGRSTSRVDSSRRTDSGDDQALRLWIRTTQSLRVCARAELGGPIVQRVIVIKMGPADRQRPRPRTEVCAVRRVLDVRTESPDKFSSENVFLRKTGAGDRT